MDQKEILTEKDLSLVVVLPNGVEQITTVPGSKPLMDLLVTLCATYHLNPSSHTLELVTANRSNVKLKPNALIGTLDAEKIILKPKGEDKNKKSGPQMPEATVRMVINYKKTQKTILRVNPRVPLADLLPAICEKCEFDVDTTVLLKDVESLAPLDLSNSLNDYAIREVYAKDTKGLASPVCPASPSHAGTVAPGKDKNQKEKENKGLFSKFRKSKKKSNEPATSSAPASPVLVSRPRPLSMALPSTTSSPLDSPTTPADAPKKRRAPQPPLLVSQSCTSDPGTRRRLYSEPGPQLDGEMARLSRGSSAESSLRRTKRKAPPPPTSPSVSVQEAVPLEENSQGAAADNTLEEIMEQEETTPSLVSPAASETQSADVSLRAPSPDTEFPSMKSVEGNGDDQPHDLSSDGNEPQNAVETSAALGDAKTTVGTDSSDLAVANTGPCQGKDLSQPSTCEESAAERAGGGSSTVPCSPLKPVMQDAEAQASVQANTETLGEQSDGLLAGSTSCVVGEDAQVQTDFTPTAPPQQHVDAVESAGKRDMATLTDEPDSPDPRPALLDTSETSSLPDPTPGAAAPTKAPSIYATDSEPKPKPSNELTRSYIPKVGMTTYTIVPQKSLEKLRYFEVALTLEAPPAGPEEGLNVGSLQLEERTAQTEPRKLHSTVPREDVPTGTAAVRDTVNGSIPESRPLCTSPSEFPKENGKIGSSTAGTSPAGSPAEVKEFKIPPPTKPKPGSFRLAQHKKTPGYYVTSAAEKSLAAGPGSGPRDAQGNAEREALPPPPPPPPLQRQEEATGGAGVQPRPEASAADRRLARQSSLPCKEPSTGLSLEKLRSFAAPRPYSPSTPSRFARAVSSAVKRSHSLSYGPKSPRSPASPPLSPSRSSVTESKALSVIKDSDNTVSGGDKGLAVQGKASEPASPSGIVDGENSPLQRL
ncbi:cordon-bleu protein-like 1b isoform X2 [Betta splendens]|nr:cordon-bleu protein-like 1b isoform X2 [Betta splendens]XP_028991693.1 cordon-bleu protein-like 1b isoform X2 [Betta splendens]